MVALGSTNLELLLRTGHLWGNSCLIGLMKVAMLVVCVCVCVCVRVRVRVRVRALPQQMHVFLTLNQDDASLIRTHIVS